MTAFRARRLSAALAAILLAGCAQTPRQPGQEALPGAWLEERAVDLGIAFRHDNGMTGELHYCEIIGAGAALFDADGDGDLDALLVQGGAIPGAPPGGPDGGGAPGGARLYENLLAAGEPGSLRYRDVTETSGIHTVGYGMGAATGDYDGDGDVDLYVTSFGPNQLFRNRGDGTFDDVTAASGTDDSSWSTSAAFLDYDRDGRLDLYVASYVDYRVARHQVCRSPTGAPDYCAPGTYPPLPDRLFRNRGDGTFEDVSGPSGILAEAANGLGVVADDFDADGWIDVYVANDQMRNNLWRNRHDGTFEDTALYAGVAVDAQGRAQASMGVEADDLDGDGDPDLLMTNLRGEGSTLYLNDGAGGFVDATSASGIGPASLPFTGFGMVTADLEGDGDLDLLAVNGAVTRIDEQARRGDPFPLREASQLLRNLGGGRFEDASARGGSPFVAPEVRRGLAAGDVDNDGDLDYLVTCANGPARLFLDRVGQDAAWVGVRLVGAGGREALGAEVRLRTPDGKVVRRRAHAEGSYLSARDPRVLFGRGQDRGSVELEVRWPDGSRERFDAVPAGAYTTLRVGAGRIP